MSPEEFTRAARPQVFANKTYNKLFCVGQNKTGTTTLHAVLKLYGLNLPNQQEQEVRLTRRVFATDYEEFKHFVAMYDAFQDLPFSQGTSYVAADALFPNSKFILTVRDPEQWFSSLLRFHQKIFGFSDPTTVDEDYVKEKFNYLYKGYMHRNLQRQLGDFRGEQHEVHWDKIYDRDFRTENYVRRNAEIKKYFSDSPDKLLVIDVTEEPDTGKLCDFLNIPSALAIAMPHLNET